MSDETDVADYQEEEEDNINTEDGGIVEQTGNGGGAEDMDSDEMKRRVQEMEEEVDKLNEMQQQVEKQITSASDKIDENSIYIGQVDYDATPEELRAHFAPCGTINRVTIMCDKITGQAKGFAYLEFVDKDAVENALKLDESTFKGRQIKVLPKRQNVPPSVMRGGRARGGGRGAPYSYRGGGRGGGYFGGRPTAGRGGGRFRGGFSSGRFSGRAGRGGRGAPGYFTSYY